MAKHERDAAKERHWRDILARQAASGLNVRAFCRQEQLAESAFYFWRRTIRARSGPDVSMKAAPLQAGRAPRFVPAIMTPDVASEAFTLELAGGHVLRLPGISIERLADLIAALATRGGR